MERIKLFIISIIIFFLTIGTTESKIKTDYSTEKVAKIDHSKEKPRQTNFLENEQRFYFLDAPFIIDDKNDIDLGLLPSGEITKETHVQEYLQILHMMNNMPSYSQTNNLWYMFGLNFAIQNFSLFENYQLLYQDHSTWNFLFPID